MCCCSTTPTAPRPAGSAPLSWMLHHEAPRAARPRVMKSRVGSQLYASPELLQERRQSLPLLWGLGHILYQCCTGKHAFDGSLDMYARCHQRSCRLFPQGRATRGRTRAPRRCSDAAPWARPSARASGCRLRTRITDRSFAPLPRPRGARARALSSRPVARRSATSFAAQRALVAIRPAASDRRYRCDVRRALKPNPRCKPST